MIVQIEKSNVKTIESGHVFKDDCPDSVESGLKSGENVDEFDAVIKSGHRGKDTDKHDINGVSGHDVNTN